MYSDLCSFVASSSANNLGGADWNTILCKLANPQDIQTRDAIDPEWQQKHEQRMPDKDCLSRRYKQVRIVTSPGDLRVFAGVERVPRRFTAALY